ncbi:IS200/IS605 family transposase [Sutterella megalosphaeroides]|uniref:IS200/IS605 family transposase n=1 Tax=Sutterella megalosphaeroides TaxID=2494234 RepID=A0A2Z6I9I2_9BURK|nr:IS200/IS605 family transposase [Sutterella megalosphaeroides]BBF23002.1 IS200/IS605 family transposase [Sutterella megalosphaeroides]
MPFEYEHKKGIVFKNQFHVIFCPKYRRPVLVDGVDVRLKEIFLQKAAELEVKIVSMEVMPDHVHLFLSFDPRLGIHQVVKALKAVSSRLLREEFPWLRSRIPCLWTRSYFTCTVGHLGEEAVKHYIEQQKGV